jgi:hypothetical protein
MEHRSEEGTDVTDAVLAPRVLPDKASDIFVVYCAPPTVHPPEKRVGSGIADPTGDICRRSALKIVETYIE